MTDVENKLTFTGVNGKEEREQLAVRLGLTHTHYYITQTTSKNPLSSTGNPTQYSVKAYMGKEP